MPKQKSTNGQLSADVLVAALQSDGEFIFEATEEVLLTRARVLAHRVKTKFAPTHTIRTSRLGDRTMKVELIEAGAAEVRSRQTRQPTATRPLSPRPETDTPVQRRRSSRTIVVSPCLDEDGNVLVQPGDTIRRRDPVPSYAQGIFTVKRIGADKHGVPEIHCYGGVKGEEASRTFFAKDCVLA